ncbi:hypothetical protein BE61_00010 [Bradyrhizobium elkanii USDA 61]|nr:hypothetical protein BJ6T_00010 [Bradyrhizobium japonicum USDA 6]BBB94591.1 hypothetical protein BE61_00010 [Bradyrhizobium elkanii USDA 61]
MFADRLKDYNLALATVLQSVNSFELVGVGLVLDVPTDIASRRIFSNRTSASWSNEARNLQVVGAGWRCSAVLRKSLRSMQKHHSGGTPDSSLFPSATNSCS